MRKKSKLQQSHRERLAFTIPEAAHSIVARSDRPGNTYSPIRA